MNFTFEGKTVLVTGAGGGSGKVIAQSFLETGAKVIAADLRCPNWATPSDTFFPVAVDVSDQKVVDETIARLAEQTNGIDILVNNAGIAIEHPIQEFPLDVWNKIFAVNATGTFLCTRAVVRDLLKRNHGGRIINISSIAGKNGFANSSAYCASKAAVIGFTRSLAAELGEHDITVNAICPGSVATPMIESVIDTIAANTGMNRPDVRTMMESGIPMKRFQEPKDVAALVMFLASDFACNINGEAMNLDGGVVRD